MIWFDIINELKMVISFIGLIDTKLFDIKFFKIYSSLIQYIPTVASPPSTPPIPAHFPSPQDLLPHLSFPPEKNRPPRGIN